MSDYETPMTVETAIAVYDNGEVDDPETLHRACGMLADEVERLTAERDAAAAKERAAVVAWLRLGDSWGVLDVYSYGQVADAIEAGKHLEVTRD